MYRYALRQERIVLKYERAAFLIPCQGLRGYFANFLFIQQILRQIHRGLHMFRIGIDAHDDAVTTEVISISQILAVCEADAYRYGQDTFAGICGQ